MRLSPELLEAVEAVLPGAEATGLRTHEVHHNVARRAGPGRWSRTTIRHALGALARAGRAEFIGNDRHRHYRRALAQAKRLAEPSQRRSPVPGKGAWRGVRYENVRTAELRREENLPGWRGRLLGADLTRVVFGDPQPGRLRGR
jgi:hypothetical protein